MRLNSRLLAALLVGAGLLSTACDTTQVDTTDRHAFYFEARGRYELEDQNGAPYTHLEGAWTRADGDTNEVGYTIDTVNVGIGLEGQISNEGWGGFAFGGSLLHTDYEENAADLDGDTDIGPYVALEGGWKATKVVEPYARTEVSFYLKDFSTLFGVEVGARFHVVEHGALFAGWRYTRYNLRDVTSGTSVEEIELDASGLVLGLSFDF